MKFAYTAAAGIRVALVSADVTGCRNKAVAAGAAPVAPPETIPCGQQVSYVRDLNGVLVEICSEIAG